MPLASYLTRLIWLSVAPLMLFAAWLAFDKVSLLRAENEREAAVIARNFATAIDQHLAARIGALRVMASSPLVEVPARWSELYRMAQGYRDSFGSHLILASVGEPMRMLFNTRRPFGAELPPLPRPGGHSAAAQALASGQPAVGDIFLGPVAQEKLVAIAVPVSREGQVSQLLVATFELRLFQERLDKVAMPEGWRLELRDGQGEPIAGRGPGVAEAGHRFEVKSAVAPWTVRVEIPGRIYRGTLGDAGLLVGGGLALATLIAIGGGLYGRRRLAVAVEQLMPDGARAPGGADIAEFAAARRRIAGFAAAQDRVIEQERRRLAREVHDQLGQVFTAIKLIAQSIPRAAYPPGQEAALGQALEHGIASTRRITAELRPPLLDDLGLADALEHYAGEIAAGGAPACRAEMADTERLDEAQALGLFRIVQEAITNVRRHAGASQVWIRGAAAGGHYRLRIEDDGRGFDPPAMRPGALGLAGMRERAEMLDGGCTVTRRTGGGTVVEVTLPLGHMGNGHEHPAA